MSAQTNFQKVVEFNRTFGAVVNDNLVLDILEKEPVLVENRMKLIREEEKELEVAVKEKDLVETVDAIGDLLYVVYGLASALGVDADKVFDLVHKSNMSKVCNTETEALETVASYVAGGKYDTPNYRKSGDKFVVYNKSTNKILKSIYYKPVDFSELGIKKIEK